MADATAAKSNQFSKVVKLVKQVLMQYSKTTIFMSVALGYLSGFGSLRSSLRSVSAELQCSLKVSEHTRVGLLQIITKQIGGLQIRFK